MPNEPLDETTEKFPIPTGVNLSDTDDSEDEDEDTVETEEE